MKVHLYGGGSLEDPLAGLNLDPGCMGVGAGNQAATAFQTCMRTRAGHRVQLLGCL